jgi:hypothetical protein
MQTRTRTKQVETPKWKKHPGKFVYDLIDPVTGGLWVLSVGRKMTDKELSFELSIHLTISGGKHPKSYETFILEIFGV